MPPRQRRSTVSQRRRKTTNRAKTVDPQEGSSFQTFSISKQRSKRLSKLKPAPVPFEWTTQLEVDLMYCMTGLKPTGLNKHLNVMIIRERFSRSQNMNVPTDVLWKYFEARWDLKLADEIESLIISTKSKEFELPKIDEWTKLIEEEGVKVDLAIQKQASEASTSRVLFDITKLKTLRVVVEKIDKSLNEALFEKYMNRLKAANSSKALENGPNGGQSGSSTSKVNTGVEKKQANADKDKDTDKN